MIINVMWINTVVVVMNRHHDTPAKTMGDPSTPAQVVRSRW